MPACVPVNNGVGDINAYQKPPAPPKQPESKISKIMTCLFWRKKTDVVDMTKEVSDVNKKQKLTVDRSDRSLRVLKMESMRTAPKAREGDGDPAASQGSTQMFLPSENPTASFLSYLNPSVRRACSEVIRTSSNSGNNRPMTREAFTDGKRTIVTRNTNYRGQRGGGTLPRENNKNDVNGKPPKPPERNNSHPRGVPKPIVVPGLTSSSDDDIGYNSDNEITDLHDEIRRMNISHPDLRTSSANCSGKGRGRRREGSISISEDDCGESSEDDVVEVDRPQNPLPSNGSHGQKDGYTEIPNEENVQDKPKLHKSKSMDEVIDDLFKQTQYNIDTIYRHGLENLDIETYRSETLSPDTCMKRLEDDLNRSSANTPSQTTPRDHKPKNGIHGNSTRSGKPTSQPSMNHEEMDNLLNEVSIWAHDRQKWLLEDSKIKPDNQTRESTMASLTLDSKAIAEVSRTNSSNTKGRCSNWVSVQRRPSEASDVTKITGILTGPKLFRSSTKTPRSVSFGESDKDRPNTKQSNKDSDKPTKDIQILDLNNDSDEVTSGVRTGGVSDVFPEPWTADMYASTKGENDRSTLNDNLSELDEKVGFRARSPGSWLSSNGSCSNLMIKRGNPDGTADCFEIPRGINETPVYFSQTPDVIVENPNVIIGGGKSHQILRQAPKIHTPFVDKDKFTVPVPTTPTIPTRPMHKNTQLKPISSLRDTQPKAEIKTFPSLPGMRGTSHSFMTSRNMYEYENSLGGQVMRPFSEIPLTNTDQSVPQGPDSSHPYIQAMMRPVSETITTNNRGGQVGTGPIMATKDRQSYAKDIINAIEKQRIQPQHDAFHISIPTPVPEAMENDTKETEQKPETTKKRHKVFTNSLMRGGYSYDKHSRRNNHDSRSSQSFSEQHNSGEPPQLNHSMSFQGSINPGMASVSELKLTILDSTPGQGQSATTTAVRHEQVSKHVQDLRQMNGFLNGHETRNYSTIKPNHETITVSRNNSLQTHSLGSNVQHYAPDHMKTTAANHQTAEKFRKMRTRRDQEMEWLMKDAAETEV